MTLWYELMSLDLAGMRAARRMIDDGQILPPPTAHPRGQRRHQGTYYKMFNKISKQRKGSDHVE